MILDRLEVSADDFAEGTGWEVKPQGACRGEVCVPLPAQVRTDDGLIDVRVAAEGLRMPLLHERDLGFWALGPAAVSGRALDTAQVPELVLPDLDGNPFALSSLHGRKVLLVAWASW